MEQTIHEFNHFFEEYHQKFVRFAQSYIHDKPSAEDIVIDALLQYWQNRDALIDQSNVPAYVLAIVKNKCLNYLKHQEIVRQANQDYTETQLWDLQMRINAMSDFDPCKMYSDEIIAIMEKTLDALPSKTRRIFRLSRTEGLTHKEIQEITGESEKVIEYHITKATTTLRLALQDYLPVWLIVLLLI